jgi:hypothetical protein
VSEVTDLPERGQPDEVRLVEPERDYTKLDNDIFRAGLSARAIGLGALMFSKPPGWRFSSTRLASEVSEGRDAIRSAMRELIDAGFVFLDHVGGTQPRTVFYLRKSRQTPWPSWLVTSSAWESAPRAWESGAGFSGAGFSGRVEITDVVITEVVSKTFAHPADARVQRGHEPSFGPKPEPPSPSQRFDEFWQLYPRRKSKALAKKSWDKLTTPRPAGEGIDAEAIFAGLRERIAYYGRNRTPDHLIPHPSTWLNAHGWLDDIEKDGPVAAASMAQRQADHDARQLDEVERAIADGNGQLAWTIVKDQARSTTETRWFADVADRLDDGQSVALIRMAVRRDGERVGEADIDKVAAMRADLHNRAASDSQRAITKGTA